MTDQGYLSEGKFSYIVRCAPLPSLDLIIRDSDGKVLVGLRTNEPAKNYYFVPGGVTRDGIECNPDNFRAREHFASDLDAFRGELELVHENTGNITARL